MRTIGFFLAMLVSACAPLTGGAGVEVRHVGGDGPTDAYSRVVVVGNTAYVSGMLGTQGGPEIEDQTRAALESVQAALAEVGGTMNDVVKCTVYMADLSERPRLNAVYRSFFPEHRPARSAVGGDLDGAKVEIECIAILPES